VESGVLRVSTVKISVIVPSYNYEDYIAECIESVLSQSYSNVELIIVDDCSTDDTREIIKSYGEKVTHVFHEVNSGHGAAFNSGFLASSGEIITFLDADDYMLPGCLQSIAANYEFDVALYHYYLDMVDVNGVKIDNFPRKEIGLDTGHLEMKICNVGRIKSTVTSGLSFSRTALNKVMPMDPETYRQGGDGYLCAVVPLYGRVKAIDKNLAAYRQHGKNHSKFSQVIVGRAKWCQEHNSERYKSIRFHANNLSLTVNEPLGASDILYLEQLVVLYLSNTPFKNEVFTNRLNLLQTVIRALNNASMKGKKGKFLYLFWFVICVTPKSKALELLSWKLNAQSRPNWLIKLLKKSK
jgi:glycosyltransferase involved in cell wall biosynthesis